jgi:hypothetical protein
VDLQPESGRRRRIHPPRRARMALELSANLASPRESLVGSSVQACIVLERRAIVAGFSEEPVPRPRVEAPE